MTLVTERLPEGEIVILGVLPGHEKAEVIEFLRSIPLRIVQRAQTVCCDLWEAYTEAVREELPTARIVADRFHVAKHYRHAADQVGKQELLRLKKVLPKEEYQTLNGSFHAFRTPALAGGARENPSKKQAQSKIRQWIQQVQKSGLHCLTIS